MSDTPIPMSFTISRRTVTIQVFGQHVYSITATEEPGYVEAQEMVVDAISTLFLNVIDELD